MAIWRRINTKELLKKWVPEEEEFDLIFEISNLCQAGKIPISSVVECLSDRDESVSNRARWVLEDIAREDTELLRPVVPDLVKLLEHRDEKVRDRARWFLEDIAREDTELLRPVVPDLVKLLEHRDEDVRMDAGWFLRDIAKENAEILKPVLSDFVKLFGHRDENVCNNAVFVPIYAEEVVELLKSIVPDLVKRLNARSPWTRGGAALALGAIGQVDATAIKHTIPRLIELLDDGSHPVRHRAAWALRLIATKDTRAVRPAVPRLIELLDDEESTVRSEAACALGLMGKADAVLVRPAIPKLVELLDDGDSKVRSNAAYALGLIGKADAELVRLAVPRLVELLEDGEPSVREEAAYALGRIGEADAELVKPVVPKLIKLLEDEEPSVRSEAAHALGSIGKVDTKLAKSAVPKLIELLEDEEPSVREEAAYALGRTGALDAGLMKLAVPRLVALLEDEEFGVREEAAYALGRIGEVDAELVKPAVPELIGLLGDDFGDVRAAAAFALGEIGARQALEKLEGLLNDTEECQLGDENLTVGEVAQRAIEKIKGKRPRLELSLSPSQFIFDTWNPCHLVVRNTGKGEAEVMEISFSDEVEVKGFSSAIHLKAGEEKSLVLYLKPKERRQVPLEITLRYRDQLGRKGEKVEVVLVSVEEKGVGEPAAPRREIRQEEGIPPYFPAELVSYYEPLGYIARGGFARVFRARRKKDGIPVALKVPLDPEDPGIRDSLRTEIAHWLRLKHGNIVQLYNVGTVPTVFLEMELCDGSIAEERKPLEPTRAAKLVFEVARGLEYAHRQGLIHRDVKPSNILLKNGVPKLSDWGLSRVKVHSRSTDSRAFTPPYSAPEQHSPRKFGGVDERTDIFQLGIVLYELVTGKLPFEGEEYFEIASAVQFEDPLPPSELNPEASLLEPVILKCLSKEKAMRYASVREFREALAEVLREGYGMAVALSRNSRDFRRAATDSVELALIAADLEDIQGMKAHLEEASDLAREVLPQKLSQYILHSLESAFKLLELCVGGKVSFGEAMRLWDEAKEFLPENLHQLVEEDPDMGQRMKHFANLYAPDDFLPEEHLEDIRGMCHRLIKKWQAFVLETSV